MSTVIEVFRYLIIWLALALLVGGPVWYITRSMVPQRALRGDGGTLHAYYLQKALAGRNSVSRLQEPTRPAKWKGKPEAELRRVSSTAKFTGVSESPPLTLEDGQR